MTTPRERFQANKDFSTQHASVVGSPAIEASLDATLAEMIMSQSPACNAETAAQNHFQLEGAKKFIKIWSTLSTPTPTPKAQPHGNLNRTS